jgi:hypothetical protein
MTKRMKMKVLELSENGGDFSEICEILEIPLDSEVREEIWELLKTFQV